ncbi:MAG: TIGR03088 family PEP-CTERM/XrtA system glycosyltransferase [Pseudomonadota bacterium]
MTKPIRIVHIIYRLATGGMENGLVNLVNRMDARFEHHIVSLTDVTDFAERISNSAVRVSALDKQPGKDFGVYWRLFKLLRRIRPTIVHTRNFGTVDCGLVARLAGVRTLIHSEHGWDMSDLAGGNPKYIRLRRWLAPLAVGWLAVSANIRDWLEHTVRIDARKLEHIYNGVDADTFCPESRDANTTLRVGFVGRLEEVKNPQSMVRAMKRLADRPAKRPVQLDVIGGGSQTDVMQAAIDRGGLHEQVRLLGAQSDIPQRMRNMDVFVLPSYNEGISNTILEAMASGVPVVATRVGGNPELVVDDHCGYLYDSDSDEQMAECLRRYADDEALRRQHGAAARERVDQQFTLGAMVHRYEQFYQQCLNSGTASERYSLNDGI